MAYLAMLQHTFPDSLALVLAAYNAGPHTVVQAGYRVPPIAETQRYVACVLQAQDTYRQSRLLPPFPRLRARPGQPRRARPFACAAAPPVAPGGAAGQLITVQIEAHHRSPQRVHAGHAVLPSAPGVVGSSAQPRGRDGRGLPASAVGQAAQPTRRRPISSCRRPGPPGSLVSSAGRMVP